MNLISLALGYIMWFLYRITASYGLTILLFSVVTKLVLFPLSVWVQKNSIKMVRLQPEVNRIMARNASDRDKGNEEQLALYKKEKYHPMLGILPMLIQIPIIIALINVVYNPLQHLFHLSQDVIVPLLEMGSNLLGQPQLGAAGQLAVAQMITNPASRGGFEILAAGDAVLLQAIEQVSTLNFNFLGLNLAQTPPLAIGVLLVVPLLAALSSWLLAALQNQHNVLQKEQKRFSQWGMAIFLTVFSLGFAFLVPAAIGLYWAVGNLAAIASLFLINWMLPPHKEIDYAALEASKEELELAQQAEKKNRVTKEQKKRAKQDYKRFFSLDNEGKQLVFYSVRGGFYRYFDKLVEQILANGETVIHYVTSDPNDEVFSMESKQFIPYYIEGNNLIYFFMKLDTDVMVMTMPEIEKYHYKRSLVRKDIDYVYVFHAMVSTHMIYRQGAFDHYDTIFCVGPHHNKEIRETEKLYALPPKRLLNYGYPLLDDLVEKCQRQKQDNDLYKVLIAPSHHEGNIMDSCLENILDSLKSGSWRIVVRPHPQYVKRSPGRLAELENHYRQQTNILFETDFSTNDSLYNSDVLITDWSGISMEYSFATGKPCVFINTPMKVLNPEYQRLECQPALIAIRSKIGVSVSPQEVDQLPAILQKMQSGALLPETEVKKVQQEYLYMCQPSGKIGADYIIETIQNKTAAAKGRGG